MQKKMRRGREERKKEEKKAMTLRVGAFNQSERSDFLILFLFFAIGIY